MSERNMPIEIEVHKLSMETRLDSYAIHQHAYQFLLARHVERDSPLGGEYNVIFSDAAQIRQGVNQFPEDSEFILVRFPEEAVDVDFLEALCRLIATQVLVIPERDAGAVEQLVSRFYAEAQKREYNYKNVLKHQLNELLVVLYRLAIKGNEFKKLSLAEQAVAYIDANLFTGSKTELSLESVAEHFHMSGSSFSRMFKKGVGIGFKQYVLTAKLSQAKKLLARSDCSVTEVAFLSGFSDSNYFSCVFKKYESVTPTEYAKMLKT